MLCDPRGSGRAARLWRAVKSMLQGQPFGLLAQRLLPVLPDAQLAACASRLLPGLPAALDPAAPLSRQAAALLQVGPWARAWRGSTAMGVHWCSACKCAACRISYTVPDQAVQNWTHVREDAVLQVLPCPS